MGLGEAQDAKRLKAKPAAGKTPAFDCCLQARLIRPSVKTAERGISYFGYCIWR